MISRNAIFAAIIIIVGCSTQPEIIPDQVIDLTYDELKANYGLCEGNGIVTSKGEKSWKLNYSFATRNDSSYIQFKDVFGRRVLFIQALPIDIRIWDIQKNIQYEYFEGMSIPLLDIIDSKDIAQILWGEIPERFNSDSLESNSETISNLVNFNLSASNLGMVLNRFTYQMDSTRTTIEFKINERDYGSSDNKLLKGIPKNIPYN